MCNERAFGVLGSGSFDCGKLMAPSYEINESFARDKDANDPLASLRSRFHLPLQKNGQPVVYLAGNSLGLQPKAVAPLVQQELADWQQLGVDGHFREQRPWYSYHELFRESGARLVGASPGEVVMMNSLTVNLHLMMVSFYRPTADRYKILVDYPTFPSDTYALKTQLRFHGFDPEKALVVLKPRPDRHVLATEDVEACLAEQGSQIALVLLAGVNFFTGQVMDIPRLTAVARKHGCVVGWDLAHAAGNIPLSLHDCDVDFAVWCNYKYLNSGPGAVGGCFVHHRHGQATDLVRFGGWWGNDPDTRFRMHLQPEFVPRQGADGWQVSNPPIMALAPVKASIDMFDEVGMDALREKSLDLTGYLQFLLDEFASEGVEVITPRDQDERGAQLSMLVHDRPKELLSALQAAGVVCDLREPNVIRVAPVPMYNSFTDVWRFARTLADHI